MSAPAEHVPSDWYADFFTELPNEFWRRAVSPEATAAEIDFIEARLGLKPGSRILDVPCGSGRHTLALAAAVRPGGGLVVDFSAAAESVQPGYVDERPRDMTVGDIVVSGSNTYDVAGSRGGR
jgi:SAM-dependent methyltransferase